jgi:hypothetical protein
MLHDNGIENLSVQPQWSLLHKLGFRFFFLAVILATGVLRIIPFIGELLSPYQYSLSFWVQNNILENRFADSHPSTGSGDTIDDWVALGSWLVVSLLLAIAWSILDRQRTSYVKLDTWLRIGMRYYVGFYMLVYGLDKVFHQQMPTPSAAQLATPLGEFSPMRLTWLWIGYSTSYQFLGGFLECLGGLLLFFRRTASAGAIFLVPVVVNIVAINFSYDIPVKLFSIELLVLSLYIAWPDLRKVFQLLILRRTVEPSFYPVLARWKKYAWGFALTAFLAFYVVLPRINQKHYDEATSGPPARYSGSFDVIRHTYGDATFDLDNPLRWTQVVINPKQYNGAYYGYIRRGVHERERAVFSFTDSMMVVSVNGLGGCTFVLKPIDSNHIDLVSNYELIETHMILRKYEPDSTLMNWEFHWVSEYPS